MWWALEMSKYKAISWALESGLWGKASNKTWATICHIRPSAASWVGKFVSHYGKNNLAHTKKAESEQCIWPRFLTSLSASSSPVAAEQKAKKSNFCEAQISHAETWGKSDRKQNDKLQNCVKWVTQIKTTSGKGKLLFLPLKIKAHN